MKLKNWTKTLLEGVMILMLMLLASDCNDIIMFIATKLVFASVIVLVGTLLTKYSR